MLTKENTKKTLKNYMESNDERYKMAVEEMGIPDFDIANCGNSRSDLLEQAIYGGKEGVRGCMGAFGRDPEQ